MAGLLVALVEVSRWFAAAGSVRPAHPTPVPAWDLATVRPAAAVRLGRRAGGRRAAGVRRGALLDPARSNDRAVPGAPAGGPAGPWVEPPAHPARLEGMDSDGEVGRPVEEERVG
jgi:hypothetical protein